MAQQMPGNNNTLRGRGTQKFISCGCSLLFFPFFSPAFFLLLHFALFSSNLVLCSLVSLHQATLFAAVLINIFNILFSTLGVGFCATNRRWLGKGLQWVELRLWRGSTKGREQSSERSHSGLRGCSWERRAAALPPGGHGEARPCPGAASWPADGAGVRSSSCLLRDGGWQRARPERPLGVGGARGHHGFGRATARRSQRDPALLEPIPVPMGGTAPRSDVSGAPAPQDLLWAILQLGFLFNGKQRWE